MSESTSSDSSKSRQRVDFADLGRVRPSARPAPPPKPPMKSPVGPGPVGVRDPDATGELVELSADDILESDDIDALEAAAAGFGDNAFESGGAIAAAATVSAEPDPFAPESPDAFDSEMPSPAAPMPTPMVVTAMAAAVEIAAPLRPTEPSPEPVVVPVEKPVVVIVTQAAQQVVMAEPAVAPLADTVAAGTKSPVAARTVTTTAPVAPPVAQDITPAAPPVKTMMGMPPAPITSPLPLEESVIIAEDAPLQERTLELKGYVLAQVAAAAEALDPNAPEATEVIHRSSLPSSIRTSMGGLQAPLMPTQAAGKPSSIAPVALDVTPQAPRAGVPTIAANARAQSNVRPLVAAAAATPRASAGSHPAFPPAKQPMNHMLVGGLVFAAVALIGLVGLGGYAATRALSDKPDVAAASSPSEGEPTSTTNTSPAPAPQDNNNGGVASPASGPFPLPPTTVVAPAPTTDPNNVSAAPTSPVDVSALPSAPGSRVPAPPNARGLVSSSTPVPAPVAAAPVTKSASGGNALPPPGAAVPPPRTASAPAGGATLLPPPAAAPVAAPAGGGNGMGVIRVDPKLRAVEVDGSWFRANDGSVVVSCGSHRVKAGMNGTQSVNVPCGGAVTL